jgi:hypothetical protein
LYLEIEVRDRVFGLGGPAFPNEILRARGGPSFVFFVDVMETNLEKTGFQCVDVFDRVIKNKGSIGLERRNEWRVGHKSYLHVRADILLGR